MAYYVIMVEDYDNFNTSKPRVYGKCHYEETAESIVKDLSKGWGRSAWYETIEKPELEWLDEE